MNQQPALEQRYAALARANEIRIARRKIKASLHACEVPMRDVLADPLVATMRVHRLLVSLPHVGNVKAREWLRRARIVEATRVGEMGPVSRSVIEQLAEKQMDRCRGQKPQRIPTADND